MQMVMKNRVGLLMIVTLASMAWQVRASSFMDDFTHADVAATTVVADFSTNNYSLSQITGTANGLISANQFMFAGAAYSHGVLAYQGFQTSNTVGNSFSTSTDIVLANLHVGVNPGMVVNYQDANNFYYVRLSTGTTGTSGNGLMQYGQMVNGAASPLGSITGLNLTTNIAYTLTISSSAAGEFGVTLTGGEVDVNTTFSDNVGGIDFTNGYACLYKINALGSVRFDNFSVTTTSTTMLISPATIVGWSAFSTNVMRMVVDAPNAANNYYPKSTPDLVSGTWTNVAHSADGSDPFIVTNLAYSTAEGTNEVIYVHATDAKGFFGIGE